VNECTEVDLCSKFQLPTAVGAKASVERAPKLTQVNGRILWTAVVVGGFMLVEAFLRKRVVHFLWASFATGALLGTIAVTVYFAVHDWRWALLGVFSASGILVLLGNLRERYRRS
jgi:hypothetical protein